MVAVDAGCVVRSTGGRAELLGKLTCLELKSGHYEVFRVFAE